MFDKSAQVSMLIESAVRTDSPDDALKFTQAALHAANAMLTVHMAMAQAPRSTSARLMESAPSSAPSPWMA